MVDISGLLGSSNLHLEKAAVDLLGSQISGYNTYGFGGIAANAIRQSMSQGSAVNPGAMDLNGEIFNGKLQSTQYADDLIPFAPKHRFLFKVFFRFQSPYGLDAGTIQEQYVFSYMVKLIDKPKVTFEYEPVNYYNYRTQILKSIKYDPLNITFYDDSQNRVLDFFVAYQRAHNPISRYMPTETSMDYRRMGMGFTNPGQDTDNYSGNRGVLRDDNPRMLTHLILRQYFGNGYHSNAFYFVNPRIESFDFDNVDHEEGSTGNSMTVSFNYDSLYVESYDSAPATPIPNQTAAIKGDDHPWGRQDILGYGLPPNSNTVQKIGTANRIARNVSIGAGGIIGNMLGTKVGDALKNTGFAKVFPSFTEDVVGSAVSIAKSASTGALMQAASNVNQSSAGQPTVIKNVVTDTAVPNAADFTSYTPPSTDTSFI